MRIIAAYGFLCLFLSGWIGCCWRCCEATYTLRLLHRMDAREAAVAQHLAERLAGRQTVKMADAGDAALRGHFYSGDGIFSLEMDGDTVRFLLLDDENSLSYEAEYRKPRPSSDGETHMVNLNDFFKHYLSSLSSFSFGVSPGTPVRLYTSSNPYSSPCENVPEPPPDPAA